MRTFVPDYIFPFEPNYDIPLLDATMQAKAPVLPYRGYGTIGRNKHFPGMYHCYVDDRYFQALVKEPTLILNSGCQVAIEPNISSSLYTPKALLLETIYWKRWTNRVWQSFGLPTIVDVNVPSGHQDIVLLGVPHEWRIYATRGYSQQPEAAIAEWEMCRYHADGDIIFIVYAGGKEIEKLCKDRGWVYLEDDQDVVRGRKASGSKAKQTDTTKASVPVTI